MSVYENKAHQEMCGLRFIPPSQIAAARRAYSKREGPPPVHCSCIKPLGSFVRFLKLTWKQEAS